MMPFMRMAKGKGIHNWAICWRRTELAGSSWTKGFDGGAPVCRGGTGIRQPMRKLLAAFGQAKDGRQLPFHPLF
jgi:hypothetical protein